MASRASASTQQSPWDAEGGSLTGFVRHHGRGGLIEGLRFKFDGLKETQPGPSVSCFGRGMLGYPS